MNPIGSFQLARVLADERRRALERGYPASAATARRARSAERRWLGRAVTLAIVAAVGLAIDPLVGAAVVAAAVAAAVAWAVQADRRRESVDRMVELRAFAPENAGSDELAARRQAQLASSRYRHMLAVRIREAIDACTAVSRFGSPGARALAAEPELAQRVADALDHPGDERLPLAVGRLLTAGGVDTRSLDQVRRLVA